MAVSGNEIRAGYTLYDLLYGREHGRAHHSFRGSFSAGSAPIFASKQSFCSIFQDLQDFHNSAPLESQNFAKFRRKFRDFEENFYKIFENFANFCKIFENFVKFHKFLENFLQKFEFRAVHKCANLVDLEKCCKMIIWWPKSALIQPRTSPGKSDVSWRWQWHAGLAAAVAFFFTTSKIPNFQNALKYQNTSKISLFFFFFQIFRILVRRFLTFSGAFKRFPLIFLKEREKC